MTTSTDPYFVAAALVYFSSAVLSYRPVSTPDASPDGPLRKIQEEMRSAEERFARALADREGGLVVADGPLTFEEPGRGGAVGYIKRLFRLYVPPEHLSLLASLTPGTRTPLFALRSTRRFARYSWFLRLAWPYAADSDLTGIVRLEVSESVGREQARALADAQQRRFPRLLQPGRAIRGLRRICFRSVRSRRSCVDGSAMRA